MTHHEDPRRAEREARLLEEILRLPVSPSPDHLSEDDFVLYAMEEAGQADFERIDAHLASCDECAETMEHLTSASQAWCGDAGEERLADLKLRFKDRMAAAGEIADTEDASEAARAAAAVRPAAARQEGDRGASSGLARLSRWLSEAASSWCAMVAVQRAAALDALHAAEPTEAQRVWDWRSSDGLLRGHAIRERNGDLTYRFATGDLTLRGARIRLRLGSTVREAPLDLVWEREEMLARITIPSKEKPESLDDFALDAKL